MKIIATVAVLAVVAAVCSGSYLIITDFRGKYNLEMAFVAVGSVIVAVFGFVVGVLLLIWL